MPDTIYQNMVQPRGAAYRSDKIKPWSHYREPIDQSDSRLHGESRRWGDASPEVQSRVIDALIDSSREAGLTPRETAYVLAIARVESGFNPDAAAGTTSASGLGQFIDSTGKAYGLNNSNRFDVGAQSDALVAHFIENRDLARKRGQGEEYIYKYHHDGPSKDYGGLALSRSEITPHLQSYERFATERLGQSHAAPVATAPVAPTAAAPRSFEHTMNTMLPAQAGVKPHLTGHYGEHRGSSNHGGTDFNYVGGQNGRNLQHPTVHAPISGTVTFSGGSYGTVKIRDAQGNSHEILHLQTRLVKEGQTITAGEPIGTMGGRGPEGPNQYAQHVHYQLRDGNGKLVSPEDFWNKGRQQDAGSGQTHGAAGNAILRQGDHNAEVTRLQQQLNRLGVRDGQGNRLAEDGRFGDNTRHAVLAFQKQHGLEPDGVVGPATRGKLAAEQVHSQNAAKLTAASPLLGDKAHPDHALHNAVRAKLPGTFCQEASANITLHAKQNGIDSAEKLHSVTVQDGKAFVMGTTPGFRAAVDLSEPSPSLQETSARLLSGNAAQQAQAQEEQQRVALGAR